jgi:hypothetical protein
MATIDLLIVLAALLASTTVAGACTIAATTAQLGEQALERSKRPRHPHRS